MPQMQSQMELHPIFYISVVVIVIFCALVAWILSSQAGRNWLARLEQRNKRLQEKNRTRKWPTLPMDPDRMRELRRELLIQQVNTTFDEARKSCQELIRDPVRQAAMLEKIEKDRQKKLAEVKSAP